MKKIILISIVFGLITLSLVFIGIFPLFQEIKKSSEALIALRAELTLLQDRDKKIEQLKRSYKELEPSLEKIDKLFFDPETPIDLIEFWEKLASSSGLSIKISPVSLKTLESDPWNSIGFQLSLTGLTGSFSNFMKFLEKIERGPYLIEIQNLSIQKLNEGDFNISLVTKVYTK